MAEADKVRSGKGQGRRDVLKWLGLVAGVGTLAASVRLTIPDGGRPEEDFAGAWSSTERVGTRRRPQAFLRPWSYRPTNAVVHLYRGEALLKIGREAEAQRDFEAARDLAAGDERVVSAGSARLRSQAPSFSLKDVTR